ncbi:MAG: hypothetical protein EA382_01060 [Spirochaetaceae bacterium]|nr:MAG: hypothetical protein EA382_01060 [Spirochaetaceae bacterium]
MISIEAPEIRVLREQASRSLVGRTIVELECGDVGRLARIGFINPDRLATLRGATVEAVRGRGVLLVLDLTGGHHLVVGPEYGGTVRLLDGAHPIGAAHVSIRLAPESTLQIRLTGMGTVYACSDADLDALYVYARDFGDVLAPGETCFARDRFAALLTARSIQLKPLFVGRQAVVAGIGNATFQEIAFLSRVHPRRTSGTLAPTEIDALYDAVADSFGRRVAAGGKIGFTALDGTPGSYPMAMGPDYRDKPCPRCGSIVERVSYGGGPTYFCPGCQT